MQLLIAAIAFVVTIGGLVLTGNIKTNKNSQQNTAQIVKVLGEGKISNPIATSTPNHTSTPAPIRNNSFPTATKTSSPVPTTITTMPAWSSIPTKTPTPLPTQMRTPTPTFSPIPIPTPTATPSPSETPTMSPTITPLPETPSPSPEQTTKININIAGLGELDEITGVGPTIAQRIIDYRNANGPFQNIDDLKKVKGIGDVNFEKMRNEITI